MLKINKKNIKLASIVFSLIGLTFIFIGGMFSSNTKLEKIAEYATYVVKNHTENKALCAVTVEKTEKSGPIVDSNSEFKNLYGTFKQQKITFASAINADKRHNITIKNVTTSSLSMLYVGPIGAIEYKGHYKHFVSPIEIMFDEDKIYDISPYVAYISQDHADKILENNGVQRQEDGAFSSDDYFSLIKQIIPVEIDDVAFDFAIQNIYFKTNYYYEGLNDVMGDFIMVSYYLPNELRSEQQNMYFFSDFTYQNKYFMEYINNSYSSHKYLLKINHYNIIGEINDNYLTSFYYSNIKSQGWLYVSFLVISILLLTFSLFLCFSDKTINGNNVFVLFIRVAVLFIPYFLFSSLFKITKNVSILSEKSSKANVVVIIIYVLALGIIYALKKIETPIIERKQDGIYEIDI